LKTIVDITSEIPSPKPDSLLIEIGEAGMSAMIFVKNPIQLKRIVLVNFDQNGNLVNDVQSILEKVGFSNFTSEQVKVYYNFSQFVLVPFAFNIENVQKDVLHLIHGAQFEKTVQIDRIENRQIQHIYSVPQQLISFFDERLKGKKGIHRNAVLIKNQLGKNELRLVVFNETITVALHYNEQLKCVQQFAYQAPEEVVYHLLNICQQFDVLPEEILLSISGMIVKESILFEQLYSYFLNIEFLSLDFENKEEECFLPLETHFLSHLIELATCE
jgi:hypothetical protein